MMWGRDGDEMETAKEMSKEMSKKCDVVRGYGCNCM
jgi:Uri superfamily endonuclease